MIDLRCGDCLAILRSLPDDHADIVVTSPPYNQLGTRISSRPKGSMGMHERCAWIKSVVARGYADDMPEEAYQAWLRDVVSECLRVSKGLVWINHKVRYRDGEAIHPVRFLPFPIYSEVVWARAGSMALNCRRFAPSHECWWGFGRPHWWDSTANRLCSVWKISQRRDPDAHGHPCPYPADLARRVILASCPPGGIVMDPFMGIGTTGKVALEAGRGFIGIEKHRPYFDIARERIHAALAEVA